ncbi:hypothetical protein RIF29_29064 [Crotalaria pallida]|uniref:Uncharacterized protein n=1 Tax=Crotalaria pallida TaxID=3830 RepID=A0AAN9EES9_CROPI
MIDLNNNQVESSSGGNGGNGASKVDHEAPIGPWVVVQKGRGRNPKGLEREARGKNVVEREARITGENKSKKGQSSTRRQGGSRFEALQADDG